MQQEEIREQEIDLLECLNIWLSHWGFVAKITALFGIVAGIYLFFATPIYRATSWVRINPDRGLGASVLEGRSGGGASAQTINTYLTILKTGDVLSRAAQKLPVNKDGAYYFGGSVQTEPIRGTDLIAISVLGEDPKRIKAANDALLESFLQHMMDMEQQQRSITREFLDMRVKEVKGELFKAEDNLQDFEKAHKIAGPDSAVTMVANRLSATDEMKVKNRIDLEVAKAKAAVAERQMRGKDLRVIADSPVLTALRADLAELEKQQIEGAARYTTKHPKMIQLATDIRNIKNKMEQEINRVANLDTQPTGMYGSIYEDKLKSEAEAKVAQSNLNTIANIEKDFVKDIDKLSDANKEHLRLLRDVNVTQEIYSMLAKRLEEAKVAEVAVAREVQVVSGATVPSSPVLPNKMKIMGIALLLGFALSSAFAVAKEMLNRTINFPEDVAGYMGLPLLGVVPDFDDMERHMAHKDEKKGILGRVGAFLW